MCHASQVGLFFISINNGVMITMQTPNKLSDHDGLSLQEIANIMDLSKERVRQIEAKALTRLRKKVQSAQLDSSNLYRDWP